MRTIALGICIFISSIAFAQRDCATQSYIQEQKSTNPRLSNSIADVESFIQRQKLNARITGGGMASAANIIKVPVVVHILYSGASQNIPDDQVKSQVEALNRDFRRDNWDSVNTPERFKSLAADVQIEFVLATSDPKGRATNGIVRKKTSIEYWKSDDKIKFSSQGGDDGWDSQSYLNIWVGNLQSVIGYSSVPGGPAEKDGLVITTSVFGTINVGGVYNLGRTVVHEVGHWLGLKHIWGDYYCGDDLVDDTPVQGNFTPGCPTSFRSSCNNGSLGDMYMNYMDYTADACMNLFTEGQKARMRSLFFDGGPRASLLYSKGLNQPWTEEAPVVEIPMPVATLYPNPATHEITLNLDDNWVGRLVRIISINGNVVSTIKITSRLQIISIGQLKAGMYFLQAESESGKVREKFIKL